MIEHALVVAPDRSTASTLEQLLGDLGIDSVTQAWSSEQALAAVTEGVEAAFVFAAVYDGLPLRVVRAARRASPAPKVIVVSETSHPDLFSLARAGALAHLSWPTDPDCIRTCLESSEPTPSSLEEGVRSLVGRVGMKEALGWLRKTMLQEALLASNGSRRATARILGVTRPAIQRMLREDLGDFSLQEGEEAATSVAPPAAPRTSEVRQIGGVLKASPVRLKPRRRSC